MLARLAGLLRPYYRKALERQEKALSLWAERRGLTLAAGAQVKLLDQCGREVGLWP